MKKREHWSVCEKERERKREREREREWESAEILTS